MDVQFHESFVKDLRKSKIPKDVAEAFAGLDLPNTLKDPYNLPPELQSKTKPLTGPNYKNSFRIRFKGDYRIIYVVDQKRKQVVVLSMDSRGDAYRDEGVISRIRTILAGMEPDVSDLLVIAELNTPFDMYLPQSYIHPLPSEVDNQPKDPDAVVADIIRRNPQLEEYTRGVRVTAAPVDEGPEARTKYGKQIVLYPKFFKLSVDTQDFVFAHELGHVQLEHKGGLKTLMAVADAAMVDVWDINRLPFGMHNAEEAFAECFAVFQMNPPELRERYPRWSDIIKEFV